MATFESYKHFDVFQLFTIKIRRDLYSFDKKKLLKL